MESLDQLRKIPLYCDKYSIKTNEDSSFKNSIQEHDSCTRCKHFNEKGLCNLNLIDKVLSSMSMELDFKS